MHCSHLVRMLSIFMQSLFCNELRCMIKKPGFDMDAFTGLFISLIVPSTLSWLHEQNAIRYTKLVRIYGFSLSFGRFILPWAAGGLIWLYCSPQVVFIVLVVITFLSVVSLTVIAEAVKLQPYFGEADNLEETNSESVGTVIDQKNIRNGKYIALSDDTGIKNDAFEQ